MKEGEKAYRLEAIEAKPTKDVLSVKYLGEFSNTIYWWHSFEVTNITKQRLYEVKIFSNSTNDWVAYCMCQANTKCKHLWKAKELFEQIREGLEKV